MIQLWSSYIKPHLNYAAYAMKNEKRITRLKTFDNLYQSTFKKMIGAPIYTPFSLIKKYTGTRV